VPSTVIPAGDTGASPAGALPDTGGGGVQDGVSDTGGGRAQDGAEMGWRVHAIV